MSTKKDDPRFLRAYDRDMLRSAFVSLFWAVITERRKRGTYTLLQLAKALGANKAEVSRWFRGQPNWTVGTIANIAGALDVDLKIEAVDRATGQVFTPAGLVVQTPVRQLQPGPETKQGSQQIKITHAPRGSEPTTAEFSFAVAA
jgi:transcriptional regulator with XRE-family HTH domain